MILTLILSVFLSLNEPDVLAESRSEYVVASADIFGHTKDRVTGEDIGFMNIMVKGTTIGTSSDAEGRFTLKNLPIEEMTIVVSGVGYKSAERRINLRNKESVNLIFEVEEDAIMLDNIVVSANRNETKRRETSNLVSVITPKLFESTNSVCLAQSLNFQPGVRVENNCQNCGFQQVRINGLEGPYSQILIDSRPIFSALAGVYGVEQIPVNMIDRVEIVRGGGSALYGSNAIAGTINIITKEPLANSLSVTNSTMFIGGLSADINTNINAALVSDDYRFGVSIYGSSRQREGWDANADGFTEIGEINARNIGFRSYYKTGTQSKLTLEYHNLSEFRRGGNKLDLPAHQADITEMTDHNINSGGIKWDFFTPNYDHRVNVYSSAQHINRNSYYGMGKDPNAYGLTTDLSFVTGAQYTYSFKKLLFMPSDITTGAEYNYNRLEDNLVAYDRALDQKTIIKSAFLQNEWKNQTLSMLVGLRYDQHNLIKNPIFSPRINLRYNPIKWINLRTSYAEGFRAPQTFDEDLHVTAAGGVMQLIKLSSDLKPERSRNLSFSADFYKTFGRIQTNFLIEGFYNHIHNVFYLEDVGSDNIAGNTILMRKNGSGAIVRGINLEGKVVPSRKFDLQFGFTMQESLYTEALSWSENPNLESQCEMFRSPNLYGYMNTNYSPINKLTFALSSVYTGSMLVQHFGVDVSDDEEVRTPHFFDIGLKISYDFRLSPKTFLKLNGGISNIFNSYQKDFDTGPDRDANYVYGPSLPRSLYLGLKLSM